MKFRIKDLEKYLGQKSNWKEIAETLTLKSFETVYNNNILDVDILPNRYPDASSLIGLAKEISLVMNWKPKEYLKIKKFKELNQKVNQKVKVINKIPKEVPYYFGRVILNIKNKQSPLWLKEFVQFYGFNSINFLVDLSNFVMIETGAPLHIFDLDKIKEQVFVRKAKPKEKFIALDNKEYLLCPDDLVIADKEKIIALAGINGSALSEVTRETKNIFIESAVFSPINIYRTSRRLNLKTTAAFRFERKVSPSRSKLALERLTSLITNHLGGEVLTGIIGDQKITPKKINFDFNSINKLTGLNIKKEEIVKILKLLDIKMKGNLLLLPEDRLDLQIPEDIVEEIIRIYDYNKIKPNYEYPCHQVSIDKNLEFNNKIKQFLVKAGYSEAYNYNFFDDNWKKLIIELYPSIIEVYNPLSDDYRYFQNNLIPSLIKAIHLNQFNFKEIKIFQIEKIAYLKNNKITENYHLGIALADKNQEIVFKELKGLLTKLSEEYNCKFSFKKIETTLLGQSGAKIEGLGFFGLIDKNLLAKLDLDLNVGLIEIDLDHFQKVINLKKIFTPLPTFPTITRDLSFFVNENINFDHLLKEFKNLKINYLNNIKLIDIYLPQNSNQKSITVRFVFYNPERNLLNDEVDIEMKKIEKYLSEKLSLSFR
ncbi:MAG: phenylalanine--tRNA ligase beta subunit [Candidatus Parcubacteria bacterium]|nr:MAG: phenylalanine--tRNA ligase beta subunit [Candidatus Parcubacteria bacterium]